MRFECDRIALEAALSRAAGAIGKTTNMPILYHVLIEFLSDTLGGTSGELQISATDLEISIKTRLPARGTDYGKIATPAKKLLDISRTVSGGSISFELLEDSKLLVRSGKSKFLIPTIQADEFPIIDCLMPEECVSIDLSFLADAFRRVSHAVPPETNAFAIPGIFLHPEDYGYRLVAVDGHRLSYIQMMDHKLSGLPIGSGVVIPIRAAIQIAKLIENLPGSAGPQSGTSIAISDRRIIVSLGATVIACQLLESEFPDYKVIIPEQNTGSVTLPREELAECLKRLASFTTKNCYSVTMTVSPSGLVLQSGSPDQGTAEDMIPISYDGEEFPIALNLEYLRDVVQSSASETLIFTWLDNFHGAVFTEPNNPNVLDLIMPMIV
jgi:DNA polymerase-3 subunit beta